MTDATSGVCACTSGWRRPPLPSTVTGETRPKPYDAIFTSLDIAVGAQDADEAWEAFGKKAAATLMTNLISGGLGEVINVGSTLVAQTAMAGMQYVASAAINSLEWNSDSFFDIDFNTDTFQDATVSEDGLAGLAGAMVGAGVTAGLDGKDCSGRQRFSRCFRLRRRYHRGLRHHRRVSN